MDNYYALKNWRIDHYSGKIASPTLLDTFGDSVGGKSQSCDHGRSSGLLF